MKLYNINDLQKIEGVKEAKYLSYEGNRFSFTVFCEHDIFIELNVIGAEGDVWITESEYNKVIYVLKHFEEKKWSI